MNKLKITAVNSPQFVKHVTLLGQLSGDKLAGPYRFDLYSKLKRLENQANKICVMDCNGEINEDAADKKLDAIKAKVCALLPELKTVFINGDPRGYSLKIKESEAKEIGIYQDWGGYGILAPEF
jgi:hypothetical protein